MALHGEDLSFRVPPPRIRPQIGLGQRPLKIGVPTGIRTPVLTVKGWCPRPLDDGDASLKSSIARDRN
jgi:hypothetical protein